jgi:hypothetical protein
MPIDPVTGEQLPYAGEPGAPPDAPPMPPGGPGGEMPPPPGGATPEDVMALQEEQSIAQMDALSATAPPPSKPYTVTTVKKFADELDKTIDALAGTDIPIPEWQPDENIVDGGKWPEPLPPEIYAPAMALAEAVRMVDAEGNFSEYIFEASGLVSDVELKAAAGKMKLMAKDKELAKLLQAPMEGAPPAEMEAPIPPAGAPPEAMTETDRALMEGM